MKVKKLEEFLDKDLSDYAFYKLLTQIPNSIDGLGVTQRKIMTVMNKIPNKIVKTAQIYSYILNETNYIHGDASAYNTAENLAARYKNALNLLEPKANFGTRNIQSASSPRYTEFKLNDISKYLFVKDDFDILPEQKFEGDIIEPYYLAPILPLGLINGNSGIAMGYSSKILSRNPLEIFDLVVGILKKEIKQIPIRITPYIPYFKGNIEPGKNPKQWIFKGIIEKGKRNTLIIKEVPFYSREKYVDSVINNLIDSGVIKSWSDNCKKNNFEFSVKVSKDIYDLSEDKLLDMFGLIVTQTETLTFLDRTYESIELLEYNNIAEYLKDWFSFRAKVYQRRKVYIENKMKFDIQVLENKIKFLTDVINGDVVVMKAKKKDIVKTLEDKEYLKVQDSYDYLLNISIYNLTEDKLLDLNNTLKKKYKDYEDYKNKSISEIWLEDLEPLRELIIKDIKVKSPN